MSTPQHVDNTTPIHEEASGACYTQLARTTISFVKFPPQASLSVQQAIARTAAARSSERNGDPLPDGHSGVFVGQLPVSLPPEHLAFAVNVIVGREAVAMATVAHRQTCGWVCLKEEDAAIAFARSESSLVEASGFWIAQTAEERQELNNFCTKLRSKAFGEAILKKQLPKSTLTLRPSLQRGVPPARAAGGHDKDQQQAEATGTTDCPQQTCANGQYRVAGNPVDLPAPPPVAFQQAHASYSPMPQHPAHLQPGQHANQPMMTSWSSSSPSYSVAAASPYTPHASLPAAYYAAPSAPAYTQQHPPPLPMHVHQIHHLHHPQLQPVASLSSPLPHQALLAAPQSYPQYFSVPYSHHCHQGLVGQHHHCYAPPHLPPQL